MVHIRGHITEREWNWLRAKLNNEFIDSEVAQGILAKINANDIKEAKRPMQGGKRNECL